MLQAKELALFLVKLLLGYKTAVRKLFILL